MTICNTDDIIDSRDVIERIEELRELLPDNAHDVMPGTSEEIAEIRAELAALESLQEQAEGYAPDWHYGAPLIRDSYFTDYIEELINDCYEMPKDLTSGEWPWRHMSIDYAAAAKEAKQDYTPVEFDGITYWVR